MLYVAALRRRWWLPHELYVYIYVPSTYTRNVRSNDRTKRFLQIGGITQLSRLDRAQLSLSLSLIVTPSGPFVNRRIHRDCVSPAYAQLFFSHSLPIPIDSLNLHNCGAIFFFFLSLSFACARPLFFWKFEGNNGVTERMREKACRFRHWKR